MKKPILVIVALLLLPGIASTCERGRSPSEADQSNTIQTDSIPASRIIVKESLWNLAIVEIDSVEYLSNSKGDIIPLVKKND